MIISITYEYDDVLEIDFIKTSDPIVWNKLDYCTVIEEIGDDKHGEEENLG